MVLECFIISFEDWDITEKTSFDNAFEYIAVRASFHYAERVGGGK